MNGIIIFLAGLMILLPGCDGSDKHPAEGKGDEMRILFLHHSTGKLIWDGGVKGWFKRYNREHGTKYRIEEKAFPGERPYGWNNYPYDYWNIWVNNAGPKPYMKEPTLEVLTGKYGVIIWKHCFPVGDILPDVGMPAVESPEKRVENYRLQYVALKKKMREFPGTMFIVWTGAALVEGATDGKKAKQAREFFTWVRDEWDEEGDNIFVWDFFELETEGGLYLGDGYAKSPTNSHPNGVFARETAPYFCRRIVDVIEGRGDSSSVLGR